MKRTPLTIPAAITLVSLLVVAAVAGPQSVISSPAMLISLAAVAAIGASAVMLIDHLISGRLAQLCLGAAFISAGIIGTWDALRLGSATPNGSLARGDMMLWDLQAATLAIVLLYVMVRGKSLIPKPVVSRNALIATIAGIVWAGVFILLSVLHDYVPAWTSGASMIAEIICMLVFLAAGLGFVRTSFHRNNAILCWTGYGLLFGAVGELSIALSGGPSESVFWFANLMRLIAFICPVIGMLTEHDHVQARVRAQAADLSTLTQAQQAVSSTLSSSDLYKRIIDLMVKSFPVDAVCLMPFDWERSQLYVAAHAGFDNETAGSLAFRPVEGPAGNCYTSKSTISVSNISGDEVLRQKLDGVGGLKSAIFTPLLSRGQCVGVLALFFGDDEMGRLSKDQTRLLESLAGQAALAVEGTQLRGLVLDSTKTSGDHARELETVWKISRAIAAQLEVHALVDTLAERLRDAVGATNCSVLVYEPDQVGIKIMGHKKLTRYQSIADHVDQCDVMAAMVARSGEPLVVNDIPNSGHCKYPEMAAQDGGTHHVLCVPMALRGFVGAISVFRQNERPFTERDKRLLMKLSPVVATGIRNAQLYEREKIIADSLQKSLMTHPDRDLPDIMVSCKYQAAYDQSLVGGDFYDVMDFGNGKYGVAIGDVAGKGIDAAVYTAMARYMIQAYSTDNIDPLYVVTRLNSALCKYTPIGKFITMVYGVIDAKSRTFTYVNAGHETPFIYRASDGKLGNLASTGTACGAVEEGVYASDVVSFEPGDILMFYTDGATESRSEGKFLGTEGLRDIVADLVPKHPDSLPNAVLARISSFCKGHLRDDIAILTVKAR